MANKVHPNEQFLIGMSKEQLQLFHLEVEIFNNSKPYIHALDDQLNRLGLSA